MLFCCLWRDVEASCHKQFVVVSRHKQAPRLPAGLPQRELDRVQSVVNAAARLSAARKYDHVTPLLVDLHWL